MDENLGPVVVGFDASAAAARALEVAAEHARAAGVELVVVHAYGWPILYATLANLPFIPEDWRASPETVAETEAAVARLVDRHPGLRVRVSVPVGRAGEQLVAAANDACVLVIGATGAPGLSGLVSGSVTPHVMAHAPGPVLVARAGGPGTDVCVGVDGTPSSLAALRFGLDWARVHGARVRAVYAADGSEPAPEDDVRLRRWIADAGVDAVDVDAVVVRGDATRALLVASRTAGVLVVGSRHRGELASRVLGSVGHALIRRAASPVVVMADRSEPGPTAPELGARYGSLAGTA
jgi:nucleotide-binding universal stress UspA family protein